MKKISVALISLSAIMVGCGTKTVVVEKAPDTTPAPVITNPPPKASPIQEYMDSITVMYPSEVARMGEKLITDFAYTVCDAIDNGLTVEGLALMAMQNDVDVEFIGFLTGAAIRHICPDNQWFVDSIT